MYDVYLDKLLCPIAPEKIQLKISNKNKTLTLINEGEINILKKAGLSEISFDLLLPNQKYPFAVYTDGFEPASHYLEKLEELKVSQEPFKFKVVRTFPNGKRIYSTNLSVSLEDYKILDNVKQGFDNTVTIKLKQYREYGTKTCNITFPDTKPKMEAPAPARTTAAVENGGAISIGSEVIATGRLYGNSYGQAPGKTVTNYRGKVNFINLKGSHPYHITTPSGGWLGWLLKDDVKAV